jgi:hypothetical protein
LLPSAHTQAPQCGACRGHNVALVSGQCIYPHRRDLYHKWFYLCWCGAYVGCHPNTIQPLGSPADKELRELRMRVHKRFDPLWKGGALSRDEAYSRLAAVLGLSGADCHIGMFTKELCVQALAKL